MKREQLAAEIADLQARHDELVAQSKRETWCGMDEDIRRAKEYLDDARFEFQQLQRSELQMATTERVRALAAELHALRGYTDLEMDYFELIEDMLIELRGGCDPELALRQWQERNRVPADKHVYKGDGGDCTICGARLEYWEHV